MKVVDMPIGELIPYENNPRKNDAAVEKVAASIKAFGFKVPIIIDKDNVIVAGHTRLRAAESLGLEEVPVIRADDLSEEEIKAFRLADNKTGELAQWDFSKLEEELEAISDIDMAEFGFFDNADEDFSHLFDEDDVEKDSEKEPEWKVVIHADSEEEAKTIESELREQGYDCEVHS